MPVKKNFYKKASSGKKVLKQTIRPTHNRAKSVDLDEHDDDQEESTPFFPVSMNQGRAKSDKSDNSAKPPSEPTDDSPGASPDEEIAKITEMIKQASARIQQLEEEKFRQQEEAAKAQVTEVEEFDGVDDDEETELLKEQIDYYRAQNQKLKKELKTLRTEFEKEKESLKKDVNRIKKEVNRPAPVEENKFFSFTDDLKEAVKAIESLTDPDFKPVANEVVIKADEAPSGDEPVKTQLTQVTPNQTPQQPIQTVDTQKSETAPAPAQAPQAQPVDAAPAPPAAAEADDEAKKEKKSKEKKLLVTGVTALLVLVGGGVVSYALTATPQVDSRLVEEYMANNENSQVLGAQSPRAQVPDGIIADKNSDALYDETEWANHSDQVMGVRINYPANVTERLHTSNSITFMRRDSYIFKITKVQTDLDLESYWEANQDRGVSYVASDSELGTRPALYLELAEVVSHPGDRYLVAHDGAIFDIWFATDPTVFGEDDVRRAKDMIEKIRFI